MSQQEKPKTRKMTFAEVVAEEADPVKMQDWLRKNGYADVAERLTRQAKEVRGYRNLPDDLMECTGTIPKGKLAGKPCHKVLRKPFPEAPVKKCPRCKTVHTYEFAT